MLLPSVCPCCGRRGRSPCAACQATFARPPALPPPIGVDRVVALTAYDRSGRAVVQAIKYRNHRDALRWAADGLARILVDLESLPEATITWAPTSSVRVRARGYDQAELLARALAGVLAARPRRLLRRLPGPPQTGRPAVDRRAGPRFEVVAPPPRSVFVVDDVVTTGATASRAAAVLRTAGAQQIVIVALARTPLKPAA